MTDNPSDKSASRKDVPQSSGSASVGPVKPSGRQRSLRVTDTGDLPIVSEEEARAFLDAKLSDQSDFSPLTSNQIHTLIPDDDEEAALDIDLDCSDAPDLGSSETIDLDCRDAIALDVSAVIDLDCSDAIDLSASDAIDLSASEAIDLGLDDDSDVHSELDSELDLSDQPTDASAGSEQISDLIISTAPVEASDNKPISVESNQDQATSSGFLLSRKYAQSQSLNRIAFRETIKETSQRVSKSAYQRSYGPLMIVTAAALSVAVFGIFHSSIGTKVSLGERDDNPTSAVDASAQSAELSLRRGRDYLASASYQRAHDEFTAALKIASEEHLSEIFAALATCDEHLHHDEKAAQNWTLAIENDPQQIAKYLPQRAACYMRLKSFDKAGMDYQAMLGLKPNDAEINYQVAHALCLQNQYEKALPFLSTAIAINGSEPRYYAERANSYFILKQYNHALSDFDSVLKVNPRLKEIRERRALAFSQIRKVVTGENHMPLSTSHVDIAALSRLAKLERSHVLQLGYDAINSGRMAEAVDIFAVLVKNNPNDAGVRHSLAMALFGMKAFGEAANQFAALQALRPLTPQELSEYGESLAGITASKRSAKTQSIASENQGNNSGAMDNHDSDAKDNNSSVANAMHAVSTAGSVAANAASNSAISDTNASSSAASIMLLRSAPPQPMPALKVAQPLGNNQTVNAWQNFRGMEKKK